MHVLRIRSPSDQSALCAGEKKRRAHYEATVLQAPGSTAGRQLRDQLYQIKDLSTRREREEQLGAAELQSLLAVMLSFQAAIESCAQIVDAILVKREAVLGGTVQLAEVQDLGRIARLAARLLALEQKTKYSISVQTCSVLSELETATEPPRAGLGVALTLIPGDGLEVIGVVREVDKHVAGHNQITLLKGDLVVACDGRELSKLPAACAQVLLRGPMGAQPHSL